MYIHVLKQIYTGNGLITLHWISITYTLITLMYFIYVFIKFNVHKIIKYILLLLSIIQTILWTLLIVVYYLGFNTFWLKQAKQHTSSTDVSIESPLDLDASNLTSQTDKDVFWIPNYGLILHVIILYNMIMLSFKIHNAM